jgi:hypothetical protein
MQQQRFEQATIYGRLNGLEGFGRNAYIRELVSGGSKTDAFSVFSPSSRIHTTKCKVKGITLAYKNLQTINLSASYDVGGQHSSSS